MANAVGLLVLLMLVAILAKFVDVGDGAVAVWFTVYLALAVAGWRTWNEKSAPTTGWGWLGGALISVVLGAASFAVDVFFGHAKDPTLPMLAAAQAAPSMFGFALTVTLFPGMFLISIAGAVRSLYVSRNAHA